MARPAIATTGAGCNIREGGGEEGASRRIKGLLGAVVVAGTNKTTSATVAAEALSASTTAQSVVEDYSTTPSLSQSHPISEDYRTSFMNNYRDEDKEVEVEEEGEEEEEEGSSKSYPSSLAATAADIGVNKDEDKESKGSNGMAVEENSDKTEDYYDDDIPRAAYAPDDPPTEPPTPYNDSRRILVDGLILAM
jgi:hypothetical protein